MERSKRKKVVMSMQKKMQALYRIANGESLKKISKEFGVGCSTVSDWKRNRREIENFCAKMDNLDSRRTKRTSRNVLMDDALFFWFSEQRSLGVHLSGPILQEKALSLNKELNGDPKFSASSGWLERWKGRHGIKKFGPLEKPELVESDQNGVELTESNMADPLNIKTEIDDDDERTIETKIETLMMPEFLYSKTSEERTLEMLTPNIEMQIEEPHGNYDDPPPTHREASEMFDNLINYLEHERDATSDDLLTIYRLRDKTNKKLKHQIFHNKY